MRLGLQFAVLSASVVEQPATSQAAVHRASHPGTTDNLARNIKEGFRETVALDYIDHPPGGLLRGGGARRGRGALRRQRGPRLRGRAARAWPAAGPRAC